MKIYFPQWQGSGDGISIRHGAKTILEHLNDESISKVPLSPIPSGKEGNQEYPINNFNAILDQLSGLKDVIIRERPDQIQIIGGDCGLEIVPVSYLNKKYSNLGIIWFDAHADINKPYDSPSHNFHGMPLRTLLGEGYPAMDNLMFSHIRDNQIHYVGLRDVDEAEQRFIDSANIFAQKRLDTANLVQTLHQKGITHLYLHFDFDCLEPTEYDQTYYQVQEGLSINTCEACIKTLNEEFKIVGASVLESVATNQSELQPITGIIDLLMN